MSDMSEKIKSLRELHGLTLEQVGNAVGVGKSTVRKWETGQIANMRRDKIASLAKVLRTTPGYLMGWEPCPSESATQPTIPDGFQPLPDMVQVPLVGRIACGEPITAEENIEDIVSVPSVWHADFTLHCEGESMMPRIHDGDLVAIRKQPAVENGEVAAVRIDGEATLKHVYLYPTYIELRPENPAFESIIRIGEDMNTVKIEGKAVGLCRGL